MELFFSRDFDGKVCRLDPDESAHCVKVLRHREGDVINVIDGEGTLYKCRLLDASSKAAEAEVVGVEPDWGAHPYFLQMAVCPTKNMDRFEWFAEKAAEFGVDVITPTIGDHSERKVFKTDRLKRILLSASKQSLKGAVPQVDDLVNLSDFIRSLDDAPDRCFSKMNIAETGTLERSAADVFPGDAPTGKSIKLIACCYEGEEKRVSIEDALKSFAGSVAVGGSAGGGAALQESEGKDGSLSAAWREDGERSVSAKPACQRSGRLPSTEVKKPHIVILIGPEGDFSREEVELAIRCGFKPVHLGPSRLRTETAALAAVTAVYFHFAGMTDCYTDD